jgi:hypothetical protein
MTEDDPQIPHSTTASPHDSVVSFADEGELLTFGGECTRHWQRPERNVRHQLPPRVQVVALRYAIERQILRTAFEISRSVLVTTAFREISCSRQSEFGNSH